MTISEQEAHAASIVKKGHHMIGILFHLGQFKSSQGFSSELDAVRWWEGQKCARLYHIYRPIRRPVYCKLAYAK